MAGRRAVLLTAVVAALLCSAADSAGPQIGQTAPDIEAETWLNAPGEVSMESLCGKVVVLEFWATWCGPCRETIRRIDSVAKKWAHKDLVAIGLTAEDPARVEKFLESETITMDYIIGCGSGSREAYGVKGIPRCFVIDRNGAVFWQGHALAGLDEAVERALGIPAAPTSLPAADPNAGLLYRARQALERGDYAGALDAVELALEDQAAGQEAVDDARRLRSQIIDVGRQKLDDAKNLTKAGQYAKAAAAMRDLSAQFLGTEVGRIARAELSALQKDERAAAALQAVAWEQDAAGMMARADKLVDQQKYARAVDKYNLVASLYPRFAERARKKVQDLLAEERIVSRIKEQRASRRAVGWLSVARNYARMGRVEQARILYQKVIQAYPDTSYAQAARKEMEGLAD